MAKQHMDRRRRQTRQTRQTLWWNRIDRRVIMVGAVVTGVVILAAGYAALRDTDENNTEISRPAPLLSFDFSLPGLDEPVSLADFRGQYVLVNFWATWCPPCQAEMPDLNAFHVAHRDQGFSLLAVNIGETTTTVSGFMQAHGFDFPVALDTTGGVFDRYGGQSLPTSYLIGPNGELVKAWPPGAISRAILERDVTPLLHG
ncbi:MAG: TlpA family protein disulfide reductase [Anaerolineae bacterium]|nr:TlpA family protein disulfide reductase [Anaerolineae bacterium]